MRSSILLTGLAAVVAASAATAQWNRLTPATSPTARSDSAMGYDAARQQIVLFGGAAGFSFANDTWVYDGRDWVQKNPATVPGGRGECHIVFDPVRGVAVLYGGNAGGGPWGGPASDETWTWNGTDWTQLQPATTPGGLARYGAAFDSARGRVVVYGGLADLAFPIAAGDTWEFDGTNWAQITTQASPGPRENVAMCYDSQNSRTILFGGVDPQVGGFADTWSYDGTDWTRLTTNGSPSARTGARMVYDEARRVCLLFGGRDATTGTPFDDTWEFDGASWTMVTSGTPADHASFSVAYDSHRANTVLFGGLDSFFSSYDETWEYGASFHPYGSGCAGALGEPTIANATGPVMASTFQVDLGNLDPASSVAFMVFGFTDASINMAPFGMPGCTLFANPDVIFGLPVTGGSATWTIQVPFGASFLGAKIYNQGIAQDGSANPLGLVLTEAGESVIGF